MKAYCQVMSQTLENAICKGFCLFCSLLFFLFLLALFVVLGNTSLCLSSLLEPLYCYRGVRLDFIFCVFTSFIFFRREALMAVFDACGLGNKHVYPMNRPEVSF